MLVALVWSTIAWALDGITGNGTEGSPYQVNDWAKLKTAMAEGGYIKLTDDCTDPSPVSDSYLVVQSGKTVTLILNGKTIDRGLGNNTEGITDGLVIKNEGTLTINGSGTITGGNSLGEGGGIYNKGTLNLNNVNVTNNKSAQHGGGIRDKNGVLNITGGSITGNISSYNNGNYGLGGGIFVSGSLSITGVVIQNNSCGNTGGGIYCNDSETFTISGNNTISDNKRVSGTSISVNNVYLRNSAIITIAGNINNSIIGIQTSGVFTSGLSGKGNASNFFSDNPTYAITLNGDGEAQKELIDNWTTLKKAMAAGGNIKLAGNCTEETHELSSYLSVPSGKTVNLDLNGCNIDRGITSSNPWTNCPCVIYNAGTLTITDTSTGSPGTITGGYGDSDDAFSGGIANTGTLTINGGTITGITGGSGTNNYGSGINNRNSGIVVINGGTISGNSLDGITNKGTLTINGGTISNNTSSGISNTGTLKVYGGTITANNTYGVNTTTSIHIKGTVTINNRNSGYDLYLKNTSVMIVDDALTSSTNIGVTAPNSPRVITSGLNGKGNASNFYWYNGGSSAAIRLNDAGEAVIKVSPNLSVSMTGWTYGDAANDPSVTGNSGNGTVTYTYKAAGGSDYSSTKPTNAGTHTVKASVPETALYLEKEATKNYTVAQKEATLSWTNTQFTYNGTAQKPTASVSNIVTGDACTVTVSGEQTNASNSPYTAIATALDNANYKLPTEDANKQTTFTIGKATLSVSGSATATAVYGTQVNAISISGLTAMLGETAVGGSWAFASTDIPIVNGTTSYTATFTPTSGASNYNELTQQIIPTITAKALTITADNKNITYGDAAPAYTVSYDGFIDGESAVNLTGTASYDCAYQQYDNVGNYTITPSGPYADNYAINFMQGTLTVAEKGVVVTGITASDKVYDGTTAATINSTATFTGKFENDELTLTATGAFDNANVGNNKAVTVSSHALGGASAGNYTITSEGTQTSTTANITPKTVGITWGPTILTYNSTPQAPTATATELVGGDACNVTVTGQQTAVGVYSGANVATANELSNANYQLPDPKPTTAFEIANPLSMSFAANQLWGTWYGDHNYDVPAGMTAYKVSAVSGTTVTVDAIGYVPANTGVLINRTSTDAADVNSNIYNGVTSDITSLLRSGSPTAYTDYILNNDQFVLSSVSTIGEHRCYLPGSGTAGTRGLTIVVGDNTTDIEQKVIDIIETGEWYDMQGRRIEKPHKKGLYIRDGKKVVIK